jgi:hypothetical protein
VSACGAPVLDRLRNSEKLRQTYSGSCTCLFIPYIWAGMVLEQHRFLICRSIYASDILVISSAFLIFLGSCLSSLWTRIRWWCLHFTGVASSLTCSLSPVLLSLSHFPLLRCGHE